MLRGSTGPSSDDFCLICWLLSAKITFALIAGASVWRGWHPSTGVSCCVVVVVTWIDW